MTWKILTIAIAVPACAVDEPPVSLTTQPLGGGCSILTCSENAASAGDGLLFDELQLRGKPNYAGVSLVGAETSDGTAAKIDIEYDELVAYTATSTYRGPLVAGLVMHFKHDSGALFDVRVADVNINDAHYVADDNTQRVPLYHLMARLAADPAKTEFEVCSHDPLTYDPSWSGAEHYALVFRGDKYDGETKTVVEGDVLSDWAFIACNGSAASKLHLWRHTSAGAFDASRNEVYRKTLEERTTLLKAITADYCGNGFSFTETGTHLAFATSDDPAAGTTESRTLLGIEALWSPDGATCLDTTRRSYYPGGYTKADIVAKCPWRTFEPCTDSATTLPVGWELANHVITANW